MKLPLATALLFLAACTRFEPSQPNEPEFEGQDVRAEFLHQYSGSYEIPTNEIGTFQGVEPSGHKLTINPDGSYTLVSGLQRIRMRGDQRSATCTVEERGMISQVQRFSKTRDFVKVGPTRIGHSDPVSAFIVLKPQQSELIKTQTLIDSEAGDIKVSAHPYSEKEYRHLCTNSKDRVLYIEDFIENGFLLSRFSTGRTYPRFFLDERLVAKDGKDWFWFTGEMAEKSLIEAGQVTRRGVSGIQVLGAQVTEAEGARAKMGLGVETVIAPHDGSLKNKQVTFRFGVRLAGSFLSFMEITGMLEGVSYSRPNGRAVFHLKEYSSTGVVTALESNELSALVADRLAEIWRTLEPHAKKINEQAGQKNLLTVTISPRGNEVVSIDTKTKLATLASKE